MMMKKLFSKFPVLFLVCFISVCCSKEENWISGHEIQNIEKPFYAQTESESKTSIIGAQMVWNVGDDVAIFGGTTEKVKYSVLTKEDIGDTETVLRLNDTPKGDGAKIPGNVAIYPYSNVSECSEISGSYTLKMNIPDVQNYNEEYPTYSIAPMIAVTDSPDNHLLQFKNVFGLIKLSLTGENFPVKSITLTGRKGETLGGEAAMVCSYSSDPSVVFGDDASKSIRLDCGEGVRLGKDEPTDFFLAVPPTVFNKGLTVAIASSDTTIVKTTIKKIDIKRSHVLPFSEIALCDYFSLDYLKDISGNVYKPIGNTSDCFFFLLPPKADLTDIAPIFSTDAAEIKINGVSTESGDFVDCSKGLIYDIKFTSGKKKRIRVRAYNFDLPVVSIMTPGCVDITDKDTWIKESKIDLFYYPDNTNISHDDLGYTSIKGRGNSTWGYPKKPYTLKLEEKSKVLGMPKDKRWNLLANWMDRTLMRNAVAFEIAKKCWVKIGGEDKTGLAWTPRGEFVELILNGKHMGNYYLCEHIKVSKDRVNIKELSESDTDPSVVSGGYLLEYDMQYDEVNKFKSWKNKPINIKSPDYDGAMPTAQLTYIQNYINTFESLLYSVDYKETREYAQYINLDSFIDWWFVHTLTMNSEPNHPKSCYMFKDRGGVLCAGPCWDFDWKTFIPDKVGAFNINDALYYDNLLLDPVVIARVKARWKVLKPKFEEIYSFIDETESQLTFSDSINYKMWPPSSTNGDNKLSFHDAVARLKESYKNQLIWLDAQLQ